MKNWSKKALYSPKMSQKAPRDPLRPPMTMKTFFEMPGYENHMVEKRIFGLSPIEKKLV